MADRTWREIEAWHGGQHDDPRWFSLDRKHAAGFVGVHDEPEKLYRLSGYVVEIDARTDPRLTDLMGHEADDALYQIMADEDAMILVVHGWEHDGTCVLASPRAIDGLAAC